MQTINLYTSVPASAEVLRAARHLVAASGRPVQVRPLAELPPPAPAGSRCRWLLEDDEPTGPAPASQQEGGSQR
ncbi:hypothetical protein [uncultured Hymenobacter sp.]|uniref:hypothetical protein n=1 Tax=uncultured Hymenobacter sp. TaxID=170016 RepID=UPI0035CA07B4